jgi:hypothetical protein
VPLLALTTGARVVQAWLSTTRAHFPSAPPAARCRLRQLKLRLLTALLHVLHPVARLHGRLEGGACMGPPGVRPSFPRARAFARWTERGQGPDERLRRVEQDLRAVCTMVRRGGDWDRWDLEVVCGAFGAARLIVAVEDHGAGNQQVRSRWWPSISVAGVWLIVGLGALSLAAALDGVGPAAAILGAAALWFVLRTGRQCGAALAAIERAVRETGVAQ